MVDTNQIRCPQCATLYGAGEVCCPHCGLPAEPAARQRYIEQLLEHTAAVPAVGAPIRTDPASTAFAPPEPVYAAAQGSQPLPPYAPVPVPTVRAAFDVPPPPVESVPGTERPAPPAKEPFSVRRFIIKHRFKLLTLAVTLAAAAAIALIAGVVRNMAGYRSSPERLVIGLQKAIDTKDLRLFAELALPSGTDYDASDYSRLTADDIPNIKLELVEVFSGRKDTYAMAFVRYTERDSLSPGEGQIELLMLCKTDGKWYNSSISPSYLQGLLAGHNEISYGYDENGYNDPYVVPN